VRGAAIGSFGVVIARTPDAHVLDKIKMQVQSFLDAEDDAWRASALAIATALAASASAAEPSFRSNCMHGVHKHSVIIGTA
jgi:hypothetical protein